MENKYSCSARGVGRMFEENKTSPTKGNICRMLQEIKVLNLNTVLKLLLLFT